MPRSPKRPKNRYRLSFTVVVEYDTPEELVAEIHKAAAEMFAVAGEMTGIQIDANRSTTHERN